MAKKSGYALQIQKEIKIRERAMRIYTRQQILDFVTVALGRMGYGPKRLKDFEAVFTDVARDYSKLIDEDLKNKDEEVVYMKFCLDRELQKYCGPHFEPHEKRYYGE